MPQEKRAATKGGFWARAKPAGAPGGAPSNNFDYISVRVASLAEVFSGDFRFKLTCYQRAYSWGKPQVTRLIANIREAMKHPPERHNYCLGRLMLAKSWDSTETELVDGHQRLITLTIIFAVLRDLEIDAERRTWLHSFVVGTAENGKPEYRLSAQATPSRFFATQVQEPGSTEDILAVGIDELSDPERNIYENRETIRAELTGNGMDDSVRRAIADFLAAKCHVIITQVEDQDLAWSLMHTEQETRLDFTSADQAKAILLSEMPAADRITCSRMWEGCEALITATDMYRLLVHIGAMRFRYRVQSSTLIEHEIIHRFRLQSGGFAFMDQEYVPNAERLSDIRRGSVGAEGAHRAEIAASIAYMTSIDQHFWVPAALSWLGLRGAADPETKHFFNRLDRLVWVLRIAGEDPGVQETRIFDLCDEIGTWMKVDAMSRLAIEDKYIELATSNLDSQNFAAKHYAGLVLRRLSVLLGADPGPINRDKVTVEHVLPRNPPAGTQWRRHFRTDQDIKDHAQRLGNLTLLTGPQNQSAGTLDWSGKRDILKSSGFSLSHHAAKETEWSSKTIRRRSNELTALLLNSWDLKA